MAEESKNLDVRLVLKHKDQVDHYTPGEILRDGQGHFYMAVTESKVVSHTKAILESLVDYLTTSHMTEGDQHTVATELQSGFMSAQDKKNLENIRKYIVQLQNKPNFDAALFNRKVQDGILGRLAYSVSDDNMLHIDPVSLILDKNLFETDEMELPLFARPDRGFENSMGETGVRYDLVFLEIGYASDPVTKDHKVKYRLLNVQDVNFKRFPKGLGTKITNDGIFTSYVPYEKYEYETYLNTQFLYFELTDDNDNPTGVFKCGDGSDTSRMRINSSTGYKYAIPLFKIKTLNREDFSPQNLYGKLHEVVDAQLEILPIYNRVFLSHLNLEALLYEGVELLNSNKLITSKHYDVLASYFGAPKFKVDNNTVLYIPYSEDDSDLVTEGRLGKKSSYKRSVFGYMMDRSYEAGSYLSLRELWDTFTLDFMLDKEINDDTLLTFADTSFQPKLTISVKADKYGKKILYVSDIANRRTIMTRDLPERDTTFVKLQRVGDLFSLTLNYEGNTTTRSYELEVTSLQLLQVTATECPIGNIRLQNGMDNKFPIDVSTYDFQMNNALVDNKVIGGKVAYYKETTLVSSEEPSNISYRLASIDRWSKNDTITILKNGNESIMGIYTDNGLVITEVLSSNKVKVEGNISTLSIQDSIKIVNGTENVLSEYKVLHVDTDTNELTISIRNGEEIRNYVGYHIHKNDIAPLARLKHKASGEYIKVTVVDAVDRYNIKLDLEESISGELYLEYISVMNDTVKFPEPDSVVYLKSDFDKMDELKDSILVSNPNVFRFTSGESEYVPSEINKLRLAHTSKMDEPIQSKIEVDLRQFIFGKNNFWREDVLKTLHSITLHLRLASNGSANVTIGEYKDAFFMREFDTVEIELKEVSKVIDEDGKLVIDIDSMSATNSQTYIIVGVPYIYLHFNSETERSFAELYVENGNLGMRKHFRLSKNVIENVLETEVESVMAVYLESPDQSMVKNVTYHILTLPYVVGKDSFYLVSVGNEIKLLRRNERNESFIYNLPDNPMMKGDE